MLKWDTSLKMLSEKLTGPEHVLIFYVAAIPLRIRSMQNMSGASGQLTKLKWKQ